MNCARFADANNSSADIALHIVQMLRGGIKNRAHWDREKWHVNQAKTRPLVRAKQL